MALATNTVTQYDAYRSVREDLSNVIYNISPTKTPFMSSISRGKIDQPHSEWQTDALAPASGSNAQIEGDDAPQADAAAPTSRVGNYSQIARKVVQTSGSAEATKMAGIKSQLAYQLSKKSAELKLDMEKTLTSNQVAVVGNNSTARKTAAMGGWIKTNTIFAGTGGAAAAPALSSGTDGYPATAAVAATTPSNFTETHLKDLIEAVWTSGGDPEGGFIMTGPKNKKRVLGFNGIATRYRETVPNKQAQIIGAADVYVSDFGTVSVVPNRLQPEGNVYLPDLDYWALDYLRPFHTIKLAKTGDNEKRMLLVEYSLRSKNEAASGVVRDVTTT